MPKHGKRKSQFQNTHSKHIKSEIQNRKTKNKSRKQKHIYFNSNYLNFMLNIIKSLPAEIVQYFNLIF